MNAIGTWIAAHQMLLLMLWPTLTAVASLAYQALDHDTRGHAFLSLVASLGFDLPKLWDAIGRMITGGGGGTTNGTNTSRKQPPQTPPGPPAAAFAWREFAGVFAAAAAFTVIMSIAGCVNGKPAVNPPPSTPTDIGDVVACVMTDVIAGHPPEDCVQKFGPVLVEDALQTLLDSNSFSNEHPEATAYTRAQLKESHAGAHR